ncbi:MAG: hypothetical protein V4509_00655 [Patescibacteria group bacterium]
MESFINFQSLNTDLLLPKKYLSWSQLNLWNSNKERYIKEYFENQEKLDTKYLQFGKQNAEERENRALETGQFTEFELKVIVMGVPVLGYLDFYDQNLNVFEEDKTGKIPWTQARVQKHDQIPFYATLLKHSFGKIPEYCVLNWIETEDTISESNGPFSNNKGVRKTGKIIPFKRELDYREVERMEELLVKTAVEISDAYKEWLSDL